MFLQSRAPVTVVVQTKIWQRRLCQQLILYFLSRWRSRSQKYTSLLIHNVPRNTDKKGQYLQFWCGSSFFHCLLDSYMNLCTCGILLISIVIYYFAEVWYACRQTIQNLLHCLICLRFVCSSISIWISLFDLFADFLDFTELLNSRTMCWGVDSKPHPHIE